MRPAWWARPIWPVTTNPQTYRSHSPPLVGGANVKACFEFLLFCIGLLDLLVPIGAPLLLRQRWSFRCFW